MTFGEQICRQVFDQACNVGIAQQCWNFANGDGAVAEHHVDDALGQPGLLHDLGEGAEALYGEE